MSGKFDGSSSMLETYRRVRSNCGTNAAWLTEFVPISYEHKFFRTLARGIYAARYLLRDRWKFPSLFGRDFRFI